MKMNYFLNFLWTRFLGIFLFSIFYFIFSLPVQAAVFMVGAPQQEVRVGKEITVNVGVDTEGVRLNLFDLKFMLPEDVAFVDFDNTSSIVSVWVREPEFDANTREISLIGGVPGGTLGRVVLTTVKLRPQAPGIYQFLVAPTSEAYLNDGLGTEAESSVVPWTLEVQGRERNLFVYLIVFTAIVVLAMIWYLRRRKKIVD